MLNKFVGLALVSASLNAHAGALDFFRAIVHKEARYADEAKSNQPAVEVNPHTARCRMNENRKVELSDEGRIVAAFAPMAMESTAERIWYNCGQALLRAQNNLAPGEAKIKIKWVEFVNDKRFWATEEEKKPMSVDASDVTIVASPWSRTRSAVAIKGIPAFPLDFRFAREVKLENVSRDKNYLCGMLGSGCEVSQTQDAPTSVTASAAH